MSRRSQRSGAHAKLFRNPENPFQAWDENGLPCLPMTIDDGSPCNGVQPGPFGNTDPGTGRSLLSALVTSLNWTASATEHPQVPLKIGDSAVLVDSEMAELVGLLDRAGVATVTSCAGSEQEWGYVMVVGMSSIQRFMQVWQQRMVPLGHPTPTLDFDARDAGWRDEIGEAYPFPRPVPVDTCGLTFTALWREHFDDMARVVPILVAALKGDRWGSESDVDI